MLLKRRETVDFDPSNRYHRAAVKAFLRRKAWSDSPIQFSYDPNYGNGSVADQVQSKLLEWYLSKEKVQVAPRTDKVVHLGVIHG